MLGRMMNMFGGKAARDGVVSTNAVKGDRKATFTDTTGRIVDLAEEKIYELDRKKKTYQVTTFEELRRRMREAQEKAERDAEKQEERQEERPSGKEVEVVEVVVVVVVGVSAPWDGFSMQVNFGLK